MPVLLNVSGGLDSALCLLQAVEAGRSVLAHHIILHTPEGRHHHELTAARAVVEHVGGDVEYVESAFSWGQLERVRDVHVWGLFTGAILARRPDIDTVIVPTHRDAFTRAEEPWRVRSAQALDELVYAVARRRPTFERPLLDMTKRDIISAMPDGLRRLCWWCRTPRAGRPCHRCQTCRQVDRARR